MQKHKLYHNYLLYLLPAKPLYSQHKKGTEDFERMMAKCWGNIVVTYRLRARGTGGLSLECFRQLYADLAATNQGGVGCVLYWRPSTGEVQARRGTCTECVEISYMAMNITVVSWLLVSLGRLENYVGLRIFNISWLGLVFSTILNIISWSMLSFQELLF